MCSISDKLGAILYENGASLVGFADLKNVADSGMPFGVSVAIALPKEVVKSIHDGPNLDYYHVYYDFNDKLDSLVSIGEKFLTEKGYRAYAQTTSKVQESDYYRTTLPHKTVATNAGLGWIGKCALLVTEKYGSAVRISSLITNAELACAAPVTVSKCGNCLICANACPGKAVSGKQWNPGLDRDEFFNPALCRKKAREIARNRIEKEITLCGKCIEICPYTQRYIMSDGKGQAAQ
jgi:epoxyqueuosine reductase